ncbi:MAG TPA: response regulator transcription factor [Nitrospiraceae bacterium]|nr:response regulator transcription factor [Nitrospiraceae bacterium]
MKLANPRVTRIVIVDDHQLVRTGLRSVLECEPDFEVVGEAGTAADAVQAICKLRPEVVLLDIRLPDRSGLEVCRDIRSRCPNARVVMLTSVGTGEAAEQTVLAGASSFLLKENSNADLVKAVRAVAGGHTVPSSNSNGQASGRFRTVAPRPLSSTPAGLTAQEQRVLAILAEGKTNKMIAQDLGLSEKTVRNHVYNLFQKLGVSTRSEATARYFRTLSSPTV